MALFKGAGNPFVEVLKIATFRNLWLSQVISQVFLNLLVFSLMIRIYEITDSNAAVAIVVLTVTVPNFFFGALAGVLVDRWDRKLVMFLSHFLRVLAVLAFLLSSESLLWLYILSLLISLITQFFQPAEAAMIGVLVKQKERLLTATSLFTLTLFSSVIVGNVLSGPTLKFFGADGTFLLVAGAFAVASIFTTKVPGISIGKWFREIVNQPKFKFPMGAKQLEEETFFEGFLGGIDYLHRHPYVRQGIYLMTMAQVVVGTLAAIATGFAHKIMKLVASDVSLLVMAPAALGMIMGGVMVGQYFGKVPKVRMIRFAILAVGMVLLLFSFVDHLAAVFSLPIVTVGVFLLIMVGMSNAFLEIPVNTIIQENTPITVRSRVYGVLSTMTGGASIIPILVAGTVGDLLGVRMVIIFLSLFLLTAAVYYSRITVKE